MATLYPVSGHYFQIGHLLAFASPKRALVVGLGLPASVARMK
jgi:hypothetical protein